MLAEVYIGKTAVFCAPRQQEETQGKECWFNLERLWFLFDAKQIMQFTSPVTLRDLASVLNRLHGASGRETPRWGRWKHETSVNNNPWAFHLQLLLFFTLLCSNINVDPASSFYPSNAIRQNMHFWNKRQIGMVTLNSVIPQSVTFCFLTLALVYMDLKTQGK